MRKFLSLLLAAVLICSTVLLPASAEVMNEQDLAVAAIENEIQSLQPRAVGDQTTYHICQEADGQVLMNGGGNMLFKGNFNASSISQQWLFEEFGDYSAYFGVYYIRYAGNPSYVLGAKQSTGEVALVPFTTTDYCIYWVIYTTSNGTYICPDYNLNSSGDGYLCMSTSYPYTFSISSSPTENCKMLLISPSVTQVTSISIDENIVIPVGYTESLSTLTILPTNADFNSSEWLVYTSSNTTVCTVNDEGVVVGIWDGTATITVKHKIFQTTDTCTVTVLPILTMSVSSILKNQFVHSGMSDSNIVDIIASAVIGIKSEFGIEITYPSDATITTALNLDSDCTVDNTFYEYTTLECSDECYELENCYPHHHKNASEKLNTGAVPGFITVRVVDYALCAVVDPSTSTSTATQHSRVNGTARPPERSVIISINGENDLATTLQHELSHCLGASHETCLGRSGASCVLYTNEINTWCNACHAAILEQRGGPNK